MDIKNNNILCCFDTKDILKHLHSPLVGVTIQTNDLKKNHVRIKDYSYASRIEFHFAEIKKLTIGQSCNLTIDLRDNPYIQTLIIHDGFVGSVNLSRSSIKKIVIGSNCRCDFKINESINCFRFTAHDVYSGRLCISNSCFHKLKVGYYCYAEINLQNNWGKKQIDIGDSFRGVLKVQAVKTPLLSIGNDCKGKIKICSDEPSFGTKKMNINNDFSGDLDVSSDVNLERLNIGSHASGKFNLLNAQALKLIRFAEAFSGIADLSESNVEYVKAGAGCCGRLVVINCPNLALLQLPHNKKSIVTVEREPLKVEMDNEHIYYRFLSTKLPRNYFNPFYIVWMDKIKTYLHRH